MTTFTSSLPDDLLKLLNEKAKALSLPKNKIIEKALRIYLEQINKAEYVHSFKRLEKDKDILMIAEEGMVEYYTQIKEQE